MTLSGKSTCIKSSNNCQKPSKGSQNNPEKLHSSLTSVKVSVCNINLNNKIKFIKYSSKSLVSQFFKVTITQTNYYFCKVTLLRNLEKKKIQYYPEN